MTEKDKWEGRDSPLGIFLLQVLHVFLDVTTEDVIPQDLSIESLGLGIVTGEPFLRVRDEDTTVGCSFECAKDTGSGGGTCETDVEVCLERAGSVLDRFDEVEGTVGFGNSFVLVGETELGECSAGGEETGRVGWVGKKRGRG